MNSMMIMALLGMFAQAGKHSSAAATLVPVVAAVILFALIVKRRGGRKTRAHGASR